MFRPWEKAEPKVHCRPDVIDRENRNKFENASGRSVGDVLNRNEIESRNEMKPADNANDRKWEWHDKENDNEWKTKNLRWRKYKK